MTQLNLKKPLQTKRKQEIIQKSLDLYLQTTLKTIKFLLKTNRKIFSNIVLRKKLNKLFEKIFFEKLKREFGISIGSILICTNETELQTDKIIETNYGLIREKIKLSKGEIFLLNNTFITTPYNNGIKIDEEDFFIEIDSYLNGQFFSGWVSILKKDKIFNIKTNNLLKSLKEGTLEIATLQSKRI